MMYTYQFYLERDEYSHNSRKVVKKSGRKQKINYNEKTKELLFDFALRNACGFKGQVIVIQLIRLVKVSQLGIKVN